MDPVTTFGLLVNVVTLIDLSAKVITTYKKGLGPDQSRLVESADEMEDLCQQLQNTKIINRPTASGSIEADLQDCAKRYVDKAIALRQKLDLPSQLASKRKRVWKSMTVQLSRKIPQLERDLHELREQLDTKLLVSIRYVVRSLYKDRDREG
jgi:Skp family chaperone for outer membrane proteins